MLYHIDRVGGCGQSGSGSCDAILDVTFTTTTSTGNVMIDMLPNVYECNRVSAYGIFVRK